MNPKVVVIGGGTGSFTLLQVLKFWTPDITAIVNMSDDGGSTGILRDELGVLPPGDIRQCLVALSNYPQARDLFSYRFGKGKLANHTVGNIVLSALELQLGNFTKAVELVSDLLNITGRVLPITEDKHELVLQDGKELVRGENTISKHVISSRDARLFLKPKSRINNQAKTAISKADLIVIAPGNLYGSLLPVFCVKGTANALSSSPAPIVMVANLINKPNHTLNWHVADYANEIERYIGADAIDYILYNKVLPSAELLQKYAADNELPLRIDKRGFENIKAKIIGANLLAKEIYKSDPKDKLIKRTLIRHDALAVVKQLKRLLNTTKQQDKINA
jgi:uncharacterized cofD-like protein